MLPRETQWRRWFCFLRTPSLIFEMGMMVHFQREEINVSVTGLYNCICFSDIYSPSSACETTATGWQRKLSVVTMPPGWDTLNHIWISPWHVWYTDQRQEHRCKRPEGNKHWKRFFLANTTKTFLNYFSNLAFQSRRKNEIMQEF